MGEALLARQLGVRQDNVRRAVDCFTRCLSLCQPGSLAWAYMHVHTARAVSEQQHDGNSR